AAIADGVIADPARADPVGLYARENDRMCVVPGESGAYRVGVLVSFDDAPGCTARGSATRVGDRLDVALGEAGSCRFTARFEGDRIVFPAQLPDGCDRRCTGRASLAALAVDRLSDGVAEAGAQRDGAGRPLCAS
ncbi:MAG: hypothetical protein ACRYFW_03660, partial [Janthinobacterium lividum]